MKEIIGNFERLYTDKGVKFLKIIRGNGSVTAVIFNKAISMNIKEDQPKYTAIILGRGSGKTQRLRHLMTTYVIELSAYADDILSIRDDDHIINQNITAFSSDEIPTVSFEICLGASDSVYFESIDNIISKESAKLLLEVL